MSTVQWKQPPPKGRVDWASIADELRSRPNEWALVLEGEKFPQAAALIRGGGLAAFRPAGSFEARSVTTDGGLIDIYARFVAETDGAA